MSMKLDRQGMGVTDDGQGADIPLTSKDTEELARQQAIKQIKRRRNFHVELVVSGIGMVILVLIWATSEYHNAGGWPMQGFSQSSGIHDVWNYPSPKRLRSKNGAAKRSTDPTPPSG